jgi:hypothetical protein
MPVFTKSSRLSPHHRLAAHMDCSDTTLIPPSVRMLVVVRSCHLDRAIILDGLTHASSVQERFPVNWDPPRRPRCWLTNRMRVRRQQFDAFNHPLLFVVAEPVLTRFEAGNHRMPC